MSTRSRIGYFEDGIVYSVYCHFDGYPEGVGATLFEHYNSMEKARDLVSLGNISSLGASLDYSEDPSVGTRDYFRWRGEPIQIERDFGIDDYLNCGFDCGEDYLYLFLFGFWLVYSSDLNVWLPVDVVLKKEEK